MDELKLLSEQEAAKALGEVPLATFRSWRWTGRGPDFVKIGKRVLYKPEALRRWIDEQEHTPARGGAA